MHGLAACASVFGLGFIYFISAIPTGAALGLPLWLSATLAWFGYSAGGIVVIFSGSLLRKWLMQRFKIPIDSNHPSFLLRIGKRYGLPPLGLLAPVTIGPQVGALLGLSLGASKSQLAITISLGAIPWAVAFAVLTGYGIKLLK